MNNPQESLEEYPVIHKRPLYIDNILLYRERIMSCISKVNPCAFIKELAMNLIAVHSGVTRGVPCYYYYRERITSFAPKVISVNQH